VRIDENCFTNNIKQHESNNSALGLSLVKYNITDTIIKLLLEVDFYLERA